MSQPSCTFNTCCGCIELRSGCLIIGYLGLVGHILNIILGLVALVGGTVVATRSEDEREKDTGIAFIAIASVVLIISFFFLTFYIVLLIGLHKNKRGHVKAYLICTVVLLVLYTIGMLASFGSGVEPVDVVFKIICLLVSTYFLLVIRSYYYKMDDRKPAIYNTA